MKRNYLYFGISDKLNKNKLLNRNESHVSIISANSQDFVGSDEEGNEFEN